MNVERVLLVDDEADIRRIAQLSLAKVGKLTVSLAASGAEALALAVRERPDVILLDVMMPEMDGPATFAALRADPATASIPVVFLTGRSDEREVASLRALGAAGVLQKPFDPMKLASSLRALVAALPER